jgi:hypothetical protein
MEGGGPRDSQWVSSMIIFHFGCEAFWYAHVHFALRGVDSMKAGNWKASLFQSVAARK